MGSAQVYGWSLHPGSCTGNLVALTCLPPGTGHRLSSRDPSTVGVPFVSWNCKTGPRKCQASRPQAPSPPCFISKAPRASLPAGGGTTYPLDTRSTGLLLPSFGFHGDTNGEGCAQSSRDTWLQDIGLSWLRSWALVLDGCWGATSSPSDLVL